MATIDFDDLDEVTYNGTDIETIVYNGATVWEKPAPTPSGTIWMVGYLTTGPSATSNIIGIAQEQIGKPYVYGAAGPAAFDNSGLVYYVYGRAGISIGRQMAQIISQAPQRGGVSTLYPSCIFWVDPTGTQNPSIGTIGIYLGNNRGVICLQGQGVIFVDNIFSLLG